MSEKPKNLIVCDTNVFTEVARGNQVAAQILLNAVRTGRVYISTLAYQELVVNPRDPHTRRGYLSILKDLHITRAATQNRTETLRTIAENFAHPNINIFNAGEVKKGRWAMGDVHHVAEAKLLGAKLLTFDKDLIKPVELERIGVELHPDSRPFKTKGRGNLHIARALLGLRPIARGKGRPPLGGGGISPLEPPARTAAGTVGGSGPPGGLRAVAGAILAIQAFNFFASEYVPRREAKKAEAAVHEKVRRIDEIQRADPSMGVLVTIHYSDKFDAQVEFSHVSLFTGRTKSEALENGKAEVRPPHRTVDFIWIPPKRQSSVLIARIPFPKLFVGTFSSWTGMSAVFQNVEFKQAGGFDDLGKKVISINFEPKFFVLKPPSKVYYFAGSRRRESKSVDVMTARTSNEVSIPVVDLDSTFFSWGDDKAAMVFPADERTKKLFRRTKKTYSFTQLQITNLDLIRWVPPHNIKVLAKL